MRTRQISLSLVHRGPDQIGVFINQVEYQRGSMVACDLVQSFHPTKSELVDALYELLWGWVSDAEAIYQQDHAERP